MTTSLRPPEALGVLARPVLEVDGTPHARLSADLIRLDAWQDEEGMARLELVLLNWGTTGEGEPPGFRWFDGEVLDLGREVRVRAGDEDTGAEIFAGRITAMEGRYAQRRPPELLVRAEDELQRLRMNQRSRTHLERSDAELASDVADDYGLSADTEADGPTHAQLWQVCVSDLAFLRERARAVDARLGLDGRDLVFRPRREANAGEPVPLSLESTLLDFEVGADLAHQRTEVRVHGWSPDDKEAVRATADSSTVRAEADNDGRTGPEVLQDADIEAIEDLHLEQPFSQEEADALARAEMLRRARRFVSGRGRTDGTPGLRVGAKVEVVDAGTWFDGIYHVCAVHHSFDQEEGLRTAFEVERTDLPRSGA